MFSADEKELTSGSISGPHKYVLLNERRLQEHPYHFVTLRLEELVEKPFQAWQGTIKFIQLRWKK